MTASLRFIGRSIIEVNTPSCLAVLMLRRGKIFASIQFHWSNEVFHITVPDDDVSRRKLEELLNMGVDARTAEFLEVISRFKRKSTQAKYFKKFAEGAITLEDLLKALKRSDRTAHALLLTKKYYELARRTFRRACIALDEFNRHFDVLYNEVCGCHVILFVDQHNGVLQATDVMSQNDAVCILGWGLQSPTNYIVSSQIYERVMDCNVHSLFSHRLSSRDPKLFAWQLSILKRSEGDLSIAICDKELYEFVKTLLALKAMV
jgi:hypothetical protein